MIELAIAAGLFGLLIGSFLNVCISRLPEDLSVVAPRSYCPRCGEAIAWYDNIPVLSYLLLRGRCRYCRIPISWRYPLVELVTGLLFAAAVWICGATWDAVKLCAFCAVCVALIVTDVESRILPDEFTKGGTMLGLMLAPIAPIQSVAAEVWLGHLPLAQRSFLDALVGALVVPAGLWAVGWAYQLVRGREGLGFGDVKLMMMTGAFLGLQANLLVLIAGSLLGAVLGTAWILFTRRDARSYELPFGLFLGVAGLAVAFWTTPALSAIRGVIE